VLRVSGLASLLPEGFESLRRICSGANARLSVRVFILILTTVPEPRFAAIWVVAVSAPTTLRQGLFELTSCIKQSTAYRHIKVTNTYKTMELP
jgi:hypothetical protein